MIYFNFNESNTALLYFEFGVILIYGNLIKQWPLTMMFFGVNFYWPYVYGMQVEMVTSVVFIQVYLAS